VLIKQAVFLLEIRQKLQDMSQQRKIRPSDSSTLINVLQQDLLKKL
jgi:hypothetical protein